MINYKQLPNRLKLLPVSGILYLICVFSFNPKITGIGTIQFIGLVFYNMYKKFENNNVTANDFIETTMYQSEEHFKNKDWKKGLLYGSIAPLIGVGVAFIILMTGLYFII